MKLEMIKHSSTNHPGYGAGQGTIDTEVFTCLCGNGEVIMTKDNIPGFRDRDFVVKCIDCSNKISLSYEGGTLHAEWIEGK